MTLARFFERTPRYFVGGALCAGLHNLILIGADAAGIRYQIGLLISAAIVVPLGYLFHTLLTFERAPSRDRLQRYLAGAASGFAISAGLMALFCSGLGWPVAIATPIATIVLFFWNFASARWAILLAR